MESAVLSMKVISHIVQDTINGPLWLFVDTSDDSGEFQNWSHTASQRLMGVAIRLRPSRRRHQAVAMTTAYN